MFYTVYRRSDDEIVAVGDAKSCCKQLGIKRCPFYSLISRQRRGKKQKLYVYSSDKWVEE